MKASELLGPALDWAVAEIEIAAGRLTRDPSNFKAPLLSNGLIFPVIKIAVTELGKQQGYPEYRHTCAAGEWNPSGDWSQGGPIMEREKYHVVAPSLPDIDTWRVIWALNYQVNSSGPTLLITAMRCYVASKLGDEVKIPEELK